MSRGPNFNLMSVGNEISKVEALEELRGLTELVLDRNKIKVLIIMIVAEHVR